MTQISGSSTLRDLDELRPLPMNGLRRSQRSKGRSCQEKNKVAKGLQKSAGGMGGAPDQLGGEVPWWSITLWGMAEQPSGILFSSQRSEKNFSGNSPEEGYGLKIPCEGRNLKLRGTRRVTGPARER